MTSTSSAATDGASDADRIALIGPGAIGTVVAGLLHEVGRPLMLCGRTPRAELTLRIDDERLIVPGPVLTRPDEAAGPVDIVLLAVKATQTAATAGWLRALCGPATVVCALQNGVEQEEAVRAAAPDCGAVVPAVVWFPAEAEGGGVVRLRGEPRLTLPSSPGGRRVAEALRGTRCGVDLVEDFTTVAWRKLLQNAAAGLMALTGRRAGIFSRPDVADLVLRYLDECLAVARAEGARLDDDTPRSILARFQAFPADLGTSILADREAGRPLEWDVRNAVIGRRGARHGISTPISDTIATLLAATSDGPG